MHFLSKIKKILYKIQQEYKYYRMDRKYYSSIFLHCWDMYPPSFYERYSKDEQEKIIEKDLTELYDMLDLYCQENGITPPPRRIRKSNDHN